LAIIVPPPVQPQNIVIAENLELPQSKTFRRLIQKKSGKTQLETIPLDINLVGGHVNGAEMPVAIINRKI
jgi:hypothetical protein